jgi:hypothetical protein
VSPSISAVSFRRSLVAFLLVVAAALTACGGDDSDDAKRADQPAASDTPATQATSEDAGTAAACDLLTTDEVAVAVGSPVKDGIQTSGPAVTGGDFSTCVWQSADTENSADTATLTIYDNADAADSVRDQDSQDLEGIGDEAFSGSVSSVWVYDGDRSFLAQWYIFNTMDDEGLEQSKALAKAAADKL